MNKKNTHEKLNDNLTLSIMSSGYWIFDKRKGINVAMRAKTERDAFLEALEYYSRYLIDSQKKFKEVTQAVDTFLNKLAKTNTYEEIFDEDEWFKKLY